jgi:pilus assembly protein Flp/PilA
MLTRIRDLIVSESGPTCTEYAIMLALILVAAMAALSTMGSSVSAVYSGVDDSMPAPG